MEKINFAKNALFFLSRTPTHDNFISIHSSYMSWSSRFIFRKLWVKFSIFDSVLFLLKLRFFSTKRMDSLNLIPFKIKKVKKPHTVLLPDLWFLSCNKKFKNSVISAWFGALQKLTWRQFKLRKLKFWVGHFFLIVTFK